MKFLVIGLAMLLLLAAVVLLVLHDDTALNNVVLGVVAIFWLALALTFIVQSGVLYFHGGF